MVEIIENDKNTSIELNKNEQKISITVVINEFDTQHFGITMATLNWSQTENINSFNIIEMFQLLEKCINYCLSKKIKHVALKTSTKDYKVISALESCGFKLVNVSLGYEFDYKKQAIKTVKNSCKIRNSNLNDLEAVLNISKNTFKNFSRFHYDEFLDDKKADELYVKWIKNSFNGYADKIIVAEHNNEVAGFCTIKNKFTELKGENAAGAILAGVDEKARGLGVYKSMLNQAVIVCSKLENTRYLVSSTQAQNIFVQRAWSDLGLKLYNCVYIFHKLLGEV
ncbi:GNAT family N-acetyltransferase [Clostridium oryzae]|uniref:TDP-fucosamine acetyltransferase n=1 Tax=Clostridium oryzae TaxID=1450648 RepID=A0A1V4IEH8_9CLOT|nr:GNAT family N-acetyltransferase [Clostridium oryzae]OPJ58353.1 TDP-fucosamine acetyltransferase [Clostridium oryzae]